jgi:hypothetical protein
MDIHCPNCNSKVFLRPHKVDYIRFNFYYDKDWVEHLHDPSLHIDTWKCYSCGKQGRRSFKKKCGNCSFNEKNSTTMEMIN